MLILEPCRFAPPLLFLRCLAVSVLRLSLFIPDSFCSPRRTVVPIASPFGTFVLFTMYYITAEYRRDRDIHWKVMDVSLQQSLSIHPQPHHPPCTPQTHCAPLGQSLITSGFHLTQPISLPLIQVTSITRNDIQSYSIYFVALLESH